MTSGTPRFSVVMPTWNDAEAVETAVGSVLDQRFRDFELLVVDDGSTDDTRSRIESMTDPRIRYLPQNHGGVTRARNRGLRAARGEWVTFLDSDDQAHPDWLQAFADAAQEDRVAVICCGLLVHDEDGETRAELPEPGSTLFDDHEVLFLAGTFAVRRDVLLEVGGYRADLAFSENTELGIRLVQACLARGDAIRAVRRPLVDYHPRRLSHAELRRRRQLDRLHAIESLLSSYPERFQRDAALHEVHLTLAGATAIRAGEPQRARHFFRRALRLRPGSWMNYVRWLISFLPGIRSVVWKP